MGKVIVAGAGIAGLATALVFARTGHQVHLLEQASQLGEIGAGIQLAPNAFRAIDELGVFQAISEKIVFIENLRLLDLTSGNAVAELSTDEAFRAHFGYPYAVVHRADLHDALLAQCQQMAGIQIETSSRATGFTQSANGVVVTLSDERLLSGDWLIGADGIRSAIRACLLADGPPRVSGHRIFRSVIPMERAPETLKRSSVTLWAGTKRHVITYPISSGRLLNVAATIDDGSKEAVIGSNVDHQTVLASFPELKDIVPALFDADNRWKCWVLCDRSPDPAWTRGRVALIGDAAHPTLQYLAQGAAMALEDAVALSRLLSEDKDNVEGAFAVYAGARAERTAAVQTLSRTMCDEIYHVSGHAAEDRNLRLASMDQRDFWQAASWLYGKQSPSGSSHGKIGHAGKQTRQPIPVS
ncbi:FAD-dependent monooxygenase [Agrobacterium vitis]|uniref:FAD-dependent monooxygenase n=1 Tax=Agrobacterium vitis TaxID=373 RepID=UPI003D284EAC